MEVVYVNVDSLNVKQFMAFTYVRTKNLIRISVPASSDYECTSMQNCYTYLTSDGCTFVTHYHIVREKNENAVVNLDDTSGAGRHWVCYKM